MEVDAYIENQMKPKPYKIGYALSGGGARGFAHLGALKALEEHNIYPDLIAGVSAGSIVGTLYCMGYRPHEILDMFAQEHFKDFADITVPKISLFTTKGFKDFLDRRVGSRTFDDMKIPLRIIATDFDNGVSKIFTEGHVGDCVYASCSIPIFFPPVEINGINYVDGGILRNFPVYPIRNDCDFIVGIDVNPLKLGPYKKNLKSIAERSYNMMFRSNSNEDKKMCDLLFEIDAIANYSTFDLKHINTIVDCGYKLATSVLQKFEKAGKPGFPNDYTPNKVQKV